MFMFLDILTHNCLFAWDRKAFQNNCIISFVTKSTKMAMKCSWRAQFEEDSEDSKNELDYHDYGGNVHKQNSRALALIENGSEIMCEIGEHAGIIGSAAGAVVEAAVSIGVLATCVVNNIRRWCKGDISGKRCVKNIIDTGVSTALGLAVTAASTVALGATGALVVGAVSGAVIGSYIRRGVYKLSDKLTTWIFGLPKDEALENAYRFMGISHRASDEEVKTRYKRLALMYHPDKGGDIDKWTRPQLSIESFQNNRVDLPRWGVSMHHVPQNRPQYSTELIQHNQGVLPMWGTPIMVTHHVRLQIPSYTPFSNMPVPNNPLFVNNPFTACSPMTPSPFPMNPPVFPYL